MKITLFAMFVALLMGGCVSDRWVDRTLLPPMEAVSFLLKGGDVQDRWVDYYDNGQKKLERYYKDTQLIGTVTWWYESGQKKKELNHKYGGKMHGPSICWYENGQKMQEKNYKDGKLDGLLIA